MADERRRTGALQDYRRKAPPGAIGRQALAARRRSDAHIRVNHISTAV